MLPLCFRVLFKLCFHPHIIVFFNRFLHYFSNQNGTCLIFLATFSQFNNYNWPWALATHIKYWLYNNVKRWKSLIKCSVRCILKTSTSLYKNINEYGLGKSENLYSGFGSKRLLNFINSTENPDYFDSKLETLVGKFFWRTINVQLEIKIGIFKLYFSQNRFPFCKYSKSTFQHLHRLYFVSNNIVHRSSSVS